MTAPLAGNGLDLAIIGGTGVYALAELADVETIERDTAYGAPSGPVFAITAATGGAGSGARSSGIPIIPPGDEPAVSAIPPPGRLA